MTAITNILGTDIISTSRTDINTNFENLNDDKIETSTLDTDTTLAANSDVKIATQKAVKAYVDTFTSPLASITAKGVVEEATTAEVTAGTDTGGTGAKLFVPPSKLNTQITALTPTQNYTVGALANSVVKSYFNIQLPFTLWTGAVDNDTTTTFDNWVRSSTDVAVSAFGAFSDFTGTGADSIDVDIFSPNHFVVMSGANILVLDWWAILPSSATGDINMGFADGSGSQFQLAYNSTTQARICFSQNAGGTLYATISKNAVGVTNTSVSSGITLTNWNNYRIEFEMGVEARFYINGVLKATLSGANLTTSGAQIFAGFGRSNTALFKVTAPTLSMEMNP